MGGEEGRRERRDQVPMFFVCFSFRLMEWGSVAEFGLDRVVPCKYKYKYKYITFDYFDALSPNHQLIN